MNIQDSSLMLQLDPTFGKMLETNSTRFIKEQQDDIRQGIDIQNKGIQETLNTSFDKLNNIVETKANVAKEKVETELNTAKNVLEMQIDKNSYITTKKLLNEADIVELYAQHQKEQRHLTYNKDLEIQKTAEDFISIYA